MLRALINSSTQVAIDAAPKIQPPPGLGGGDILGVGVSMFIVIGVIVVLGWLYSRSRFNAGGSSGVINVVASHALGPKERLLVVEVADQQLLVGMTATGVRTLHVFEKPVCIAENTGHPAGFASRLRTAFQEINK